MSQNTIIGKKKILLKNVYIYLCALVHFVKNTNRLFIIISRESTIKPLKCIIIYWNIDALHLHLLIRPLETFSYSNAQKYNLKWIATCEELLSKQKLNTPKITEKTTETPNSINILNNRRLFCLYLLLFLVF